MINIQQHLQSMEQKCDIQIAWGEGGGREGGGGGGGHYFWNLQDTWIKTRSHILVVRHKL